MLKHPSAWIVLTVLAAIAIWLAMSASRARSAPESQAGTDQVSSDELRLEPEAWVEDLSRDGEAVVRTLVKGEDGQAHDTTFKTLGPLSVDAVNSVIAFMNEEISDLEKALNTAMDAPDLGSSSALRRYSQDLRLIRRIELFRARREQVKAGAYFTVPLEGGEVPPLPKGVAQWRGGPYLLAAGGLCLTIVWTDTSRRAAIAEIDSAIREVAQAEADDALRAFQARPQAERRQWIERLHELESKRAEGLSTMSENEMLELAAMRTQIKHMRARVDRTHATLYR